MKIAIIGLYEEGKKAFNSFINDNWEIYASDSNCNIRLKGLNIPLASIDLSKNTESMSIVYENIQLDLGRREENFILNNDVVFFDPEIYGSILSKTIFNSGKFLTDILNKHKKIFTIAIVGEFGKTTTLLMLETILKNAGLKVLAGGNDEIGYCDLILKANKFEYDVLIVELNNEYIDYYKYCFDFDLIALTDQTFVEFFDDYILANNYSKNFNIKVPCSFNYLNANLASDIALKMDISKDLIKSSLENFIPPFGIFNYYKINDVDIYIGNTENSVILDSLIKEFDFYAIFLGSADLNEDFKLNIFNNIINYDIDNIVVFPGEIDYVNSFVYYLDDLGFKGNIQIANSLDDVIYYVAEFSHENKILIGGFGKKAIIKIQERLSLLTKNCSNNNI